MQHKVFISILLSFGLCLFSGCSSEIDTYPELVNQGILPLSTTNPYSGSNLFLAREMERSSYLYHFLKNQGAPTAIEISERGNRPVHMVLFYPRNKEVYAADLQIRGELRQWIVRGPYAIERLDYKELQGMDASLIGEPVFVVWGRQQRFKFDHPAEPNKVIVAVVPPTPVPTPTPTPKPAKKKPSKIIKSPEDVTPVDKEFRPLNSDQQAIQMAKGFAERADNGDVIHTVKGANETLGSLAKWYTGKEDTAKELAELNGLSENNPLSVGARVRIPLKKVKNFKIP